VIGVGKNGIGIHKFGIKKFDEELELNGIDKMESTPFLI